ncbi:MAG: SDR family oxidoreductase [Bacteroidetes bacterium]|nr:SDR family oxidoreductase [Bacteroidota bacterium]
MFDLAGKTACIVGGAGYLGSAICKGLLSQQAHVIICDLNKERLEALEKSLVQDYSKDRIEIYSLDISDPELIKDFFKQVSEQGKKIDIIINATFAAIGKPFPEITEVEFNRVNEINITATFSFLKHALPHMSDGGSVILFSSMYGIIPPNYHDYPEGLTPNPIEYGAGKAAINQLTKYFAAFCGKRGIRVNAIAPGAFPWNASHSENPEFIDNLSRKSMLGRIGQQQEIIGPVVFLASDEASYITGQIISVDGGVTAW